MTKPKRVRLVGGPNGSGKSSLIDILTPSLLVNYLNADEVEKQWQLKKSPSIISDNESYFFKYFLDFAQKSTLWHYVAEDYIPWSCVKEMNSFFHSEGNSYWASLVVNFFRHQFLDQQETHSFESVMSSPDKLEFLLECKKQGFRTYLYFIATESPLINVERVKYRVLNGGHPVPVDKIISRYERSIQELKKAIPKLDRVFVFDNSGFKAKLVAEWEEGHPKYLSHNTPQWLKSIL